MIHARYILLYVFSVRWRWQHFCFRQTCWKRFFYIEPSLIIWIMQWKTRSSELWATSLKIEGKFSSELDYFQPNWSKHIVYGEKIYLKFLWNCCKGNYQRAVQWKGVLYEGTMCGGKLWRVKKLWDQAVQYVSKLCNQAWKLYMTKVSYAITLEICAIRQKAVWPNWQAVQYEQAVQSSWEAVQYVSNLCNQAEKLHITK